MNGQWKNDVSGWNNKDSKRKKQTHNNRLRDNGTFVVRKFDGWRDKNKKVNPEVFRTETETEIVYTGSRYGTDAKVHYKAEIFFVQVSFRSIDENGEFIVDFQGSYGTHYKKEYRYIKAYRDENARCGYSDDTCKWRTLDGIKLWEHFGLTNSWKWNIAVSSERRTQKFINLDTTDINKRRSEVHIEDHDADGDFIYSKPLSSWKRMTFFNDGKRRKYAQNYANRMDRRNIKAWINKHDTSKELKTHALSKSILWEIW